VLNGNNERPLRNRLPASGWWTASRATTGSTTSRAVPHHFSRQYGAAQRYQRLVVNCGQADSRRA